MAFEASNNLAYRLSSRLDAAAANSRVMNPFDDNALGPSRTFGRWVMMGLTR